MCVRRAVGFASRRSLLHCILRRFVTLTNNFPLPLHFPALVAARPQLPPPDLPQRAQQASPRAALTCQRLSLARGVSSWRGGSRVCRG